MADPLTLFASVPEPYKRAALKFAKDTAVPRIRALWQGRVDEAKVKQIGEAYAARITIYGGYTRSFLHDSRVHIRRFYRPMEFKTQRRRVDDSFKAIAGLGSLVCVIGHAGTGKSSTLKHLCWECVEQGHAIPVFIELRRLPRYAIDAGKVKAIGILEAIGREMMGFDMPKAVNLLLSKPGMAIFLDGFDELPKAERPQYANEILILSQRYPHTRWILASRPDNMVTALDAAVQVHPVKLSLDRACQFVDRYDIDAEQQSEFKEQLRSGLYGQHRSFAENPLLLAVLFLTYRKYLRIADRPAMFYDEVFETLCSRHDQRKGFERSLASGLTIERLVKAVELFCYLTAVDVRLTFTRSELREYLQEVKGALQIEASLDDLLSDLTQSVSLMVEEGLDYTFLHRALQEFLGAKFIMGLPPSQRVEATQTAVRSPEQSLLLKVLLELDPDTALSAFVWPPLNELKSAIEHHDLLDPGVFLDALVEGVLRDIGRSFDSLPTAAEARELTERSRLWHGLRAVAGLLPETMRSCEYLFGDEYRGNPSPWSRTGGFTGWWLDDKGEPLGKEARDLRQLGSAFYRKYSHFGAAEYNVGVTLESLDWVVRTHHRLSSDKASRGREKRNVLALVKRWSDSPRE